MTAMANIVPENLDHVEGIEGPETRAKVLDSDAISNGVYKLPVSVRIVPVDRSSRWLALGWRDFMAAPVLSLICGGCFTILSFALTFGLLKMDLGSLILPLAGGFMLVSPILAVGFYSVSQLIEKGEPVTFPAMWQGCMRNIGQVTAMSVVLLIFQFTWILIAISLFAGFFGAAPPPLEHFIEDVVFSAHGFPFLAVGTILGGILAAAIFAISAVSIPILMDRDVDVVTAIIISVITVRANLKVMVGWAGMIGVLMGLGLGTFYLGLTVAFPLLGYATWHAYRDLIRDGDETIYGD